jgi:hypothetical protein
MTGVLALAYVVLIGEATHCRYLSSSQTHQHSSAPDTTPHEMHCSAANHGSAVIAPPHSFSIHSFLVLGPTVYAGQANDASSRLLSTSPRSPPFA